MDAVGAMRRRGGSARIPVAACPRARSGHQHMTARRILIMPKWYPWPDRPVFGLFCREQARAVAARNDVRVMAFTPQQMCGLALFRYWDDPAEPVRTLRLVYRRPALRPAAMATQLIGMSMALRA